MPQDQQNEILSAFGLEPQIKGKKKPVQRNVILDAFFQKLPTDVVPTKRVSTLPSQAQKITELPSLKPELPGFQTVQPSTTQVFQRPPGAQRTETLIEKGIRIAKEPLLQVSKFIPDPDDPKNAGIVESFFIGTPLRGANKNVKKVVFGAFKGGVQALEGLTSPTNIGLLVASGGVSTAVRPFVSLTFAGHMGYGLGKEFNALKDEFTTAVEAGDYGKAAQIASNALATVGFITGATVHGGKGFATELVTRKTGKVTGDILPKKPIQEKLPFEIKDVIEQPPEQFQQQLREVSRGFVEKELTLERQIKDIGGIRKEELAEFGITPKDNISLYKQTVGKLGADDVAKSLGFDSARDLIDEAKIQRQGRQKPVEKIVTPLEGEEIIRADDLKVGDKFTVEGEEFVVEKKTGKAVRLVDGRPMEINPDGTIVFDKGSLERVKPTPKPKEKTVERAVEVEFGEKPSEGNLDKIVKFQKELELAESGDVFIPSSRKSFIKSQLEKFKAESNQELGIVYKGKPLLPKSAVEYTDVLLERAAIQKSAKRIIRKNLGALEQKKEAGYNRRKESQKFWDRKTRNKAFIRDFILKSESGKIIEIGRKYGKEMAREAKGFRDRLEAAFEMTKEDFTNYIENYWPHIWKNPKKAQAFVSAYFKKIGKPNFSKKRSIELWEEGLKAKLEPKTWNPEEMVQMREVAAYQWLTSKNIVKNLREEKLLGFYRQDNLPEGWIFLDHPAFRRRHIIEKRGEKPRVMEIQGAAPEHAAKVINNWLAPSLWSRQDKIGTAFRVAMRVKNPLVAIKLGLSAFHAVEITGSSIANQMNVAARAAISGEGLKTFAIELAKVPVAFGIGAVQGGKLKRAFKFGTEKLPADDWRVGAIDMVRRAGGRPDMTRQELFDSVETMKRAWRQGKFGKAIAKSPLAGIESVMAPLMKVYVPNIKMYSFYKLAEREMANFNRNHPGASRAAIDRKLQEVWDSADNRFGQVVYDNIFWNKTVKDVLIGSSLSLGWNLGVFREFGGAYWDIGKAVSLGLAGKNGNLFSNKVLYSMTYPIVMGTIGATIGKILTGENPKEVKDLFYPKTGAKNSDGSDERLMVPTQMKEYFAWNEAIRKRGLIKGPAVVLSHKAAPVWSMAFEMIGNEDYFGTKISDAPTGTWQWGKDYSEFMINFLEPISVSGVRRTQSETAKKYGLGFAGFNPAPRYVTRSLTQKRIYDFYDSVWGNKTKTKKEGERLKLRAKLKEKIRKGTDTLEDFRKALMDGVITKGGVRRFKNSVRLDGDLRMFGNLPSAIQTDLMSEMNDEEIQRYVWYANREARINYSKWKQQK